MPDFALSGELVLLRDTARAFAQERLRPREREAEQARAVGDETSRLFVEAGLAATEWTESLGGAALGALAGAVVREELAAGDAGAALALDPLGPAFHALRELGGDAALERFAAPLVSVPARRALLVFDVTPRLRTGAGQARGHLPWLPADRVDLLVVLERERAYVLEQGFALETVRGSGLRAAGASAVEVDAPVAAEWVSTPRARRALAHARLGTAALLVGVARQASEYARRYAQERVAFGRPIAHHQALAFLLADLASAVDGARLLVWEAAWRLDAGLAAEEACAAAIVEAVEAASFVTPNAIQVLGGHGFMQDHPVEKYLRDARALGLLHGGVDLAREDAGRDLLSARGLVTLGADDPTEAAGI